MALTGPPSNALSVTLPGATPGSVTGLTVTNVTSTSITAQWNAETAASGARAYVLEYQAGGAGSWTVAGGAPIIDAANPYGNIGPYGFTLTGLTAGTAYNFRIHAVNNFGAGPVSATVTASTTGGSASGTTTWNSADLSSVSLDATTQLTATSTGQYGGFVRSTTAKSTGRVYASAVIATASTDWSFGIANANFPAYTPLGSTADGAGVEPVQAPQAVYFAGKKSTGTGAQAASANGAVIGSTTQTLYDATGEAVTLVGATNGQFSVAFNGTTDPNSGTTAVQLLYYNGLIWRQDESGIWYSKANSSGAWSGGGADPREAQAANASPNGTVIGNTTSTYVDFYGETIGLTGSGNGSFQMTFNGVADTSVSNIVQALYWNGLNYYQDPSGFWYSRANQASAWSGRGPDPRTTSSPAASAGDEVVVALDFTTSPPQLWWTDKAMIATVGTGAWNGQICTPFVNGGISLTGLNAGPWYLCFEDDLGGAATLRTGTNVGSTLGIALPAGGTLWDAVQGATGVAPSAPTNLVGTASSNAAALSWGAPTSGTATGYTVQFRTSGSTTWYPGAVVSGLTATINGLMGGTAYDFLITPFNAAGNGTAVQFSTDTVVATTSLLRYRGLNAKGSVLTSAGLTAMAGSVGNANAVILPVVCSTASQTSTDVQFDVPLTTVSTWVANAKAAGFTPWLAVYLSCRDGTSASTITPGPSFAGVATFFANLQTICTQVATLGSTSGAVGMFCGMGLSPWAGYVQGDLGPYSVTRMAQWESVYTACKSAWPAGVIAYAARQTTMGYAAPQSDWSAKWTFWDAVAFLIFPNVAASNTTQAQIEAALDGVPDIDSETNACTGPVSLFVALDAYAKKIGRKIIIAACGIVPATGNQAQANSPLATPPPYDYTMGSAWWQAVCDEVAKHVGVLDGFFAFSGSVSGATGTNYGADYFGVQGWNAASIINATYGNLNGSGTTTSVGAPANLLVSGVTSTGFTLSWGTVMGTSVSYVAAISTDQQNWTTQPATTNLSVVFTGEKPSTTYYVRVQAISGSITGPWSSTVSVTTPASAGTNTINVSAITNVVNGSGFYVSGTLGSYTNAPTLQYSDDGGTAQQMPASAVISATGFKFYHPPLSQGSHTITVQDAGNTTVSGRVTITVPANTAYVPPSGGATTPTGGGAGPAAVIQLLKSVTGHHCISGQFIERGNDATLGYANILKIQKDTGKLLGLVCGDYWWFGSTDLTADTTVNQYLKTHWKAGGLVMLSFSMPNPTTRGSLQDLSSLDAGGLLQPGTTSNTNLNTSLDGIAAGLLDLQNAGVSVLVAPFHENNGNWFWWGVSLLNNSQFQALYKYTHDRLVKTHGLTNLVFVNKLNAGIGSLSTAQGRDPGAGYVDGYGIDLYSSNPGGDGPGDYNILTQMKGSFVAITEFGAGSPSVGDRSFAETTLIAALKTMPNYCFWNQWWDGNGSNLGWGLDTTAGYPGTVQNALQDPWVYNVGDFKLPTITTGGGGGTTTAAAPSADGSQLSVGSNEALYDSAGNAYTIVASAGSPNNSVVTSAGPVITDANGVTWGFNSSGQMVRNGVANTATSGVVELLYVNGTIWAQNSAGNYYSYDANGNYVSGPQTTSPLTATPTTITATTAQNTGVGQVAMNGVVDTTTYNVVEIALVGGEIYHENSSQNWYYKTSPSASWTQATASPFGGTTTITPPPTTTKLTILCVGDSVTEGGGTGNATNDGPPPGSFRAPLYSNLVAAGYTVQMVGDHTTNPGSLPSGQQGHDGYGGYSIETINGSSVAPGILDVLKANNTLAKYQPNVVTLEIGSNNMYVGAPYNIGPAAAYQQLKNDLLPYIFAQAPNAKVIVSTLQSYINQDLGIPTSDSGSSSEIGYYNWLLLNQLQKDVTNPNLSVVDYNGAEQAAPGGPQAYTGPDGVHPNIAGCNLFAQVWQTQIQKLFPLTTATTGNQVFGPLASATTGTWQVGSINGMYYKYLLPSGYDATKSYACLLYLHQLDQGDTFYNSLASGAAPATASDAVQSQIDPWFNTVAWRQAYPCIVIAPLLDMRADDSGNTINWGGVDTTVQPSETNIIALMSQFESQYSIDKTRIYITGNSMGGIGSWDYSIKYNIQTGTKGKIFKAALILAGAVYDWGYPTPNASVVSALTNFPIWAIHGAQDTQVPLQWDQNMYAAYGGSTAYNGSKAPNGNMRYLQDPNLSHDVWDTYYPLPGGSGYWNWLFSQ